MEKKINERLTPGDISEALLAEHVFAYNYVKDKIKGMNVIEIGFGDGYGTSILAKYADKITAVDYNEDTVKKADNKYKDINIKFICADAVKLPFEDNVFDCCVSFEVIEHIKDYLKYLSEIKRVIKKGGSYYVATPNKLYLESNGYIKKGEVSNPNHFVEFTPHELKRLLERFFSRVKVSIVIPDDKVIRVKNTDRNVYWILEKSGLLKLYSVFVPKWIKKLGRKILAKDSGITAGSYVLESFSSENEASGNLFAECVK